MRQERSAVLRAIDLMNMPSRVRFVRSEPLPDGVEILLRLVAGDPAAELAAATLSERGATAIRQAATFFIEQILLAPDADSYRVLGGDNATSNEDLRRNMAWLLKWLHPDLGLSGERSVFARRVTGAWEDLKTPDRRKAYEETRQRQLSAKSTVEMPVRSRRARRSDREYNELEATMAAPAGLRGLWYRLALRLFVRRRAG